MARSNGPQVPPGAGRTPRPDPQSWAQGTQPRPAASRAPQQSNSFAPQSAGAAYQQAAYSAQQPQQPAADPRYARPQSADPRTAAPQQRAPAGTSSAFDALVAQQPSPSYSGTQYDASARQPAYPSLNQPATQGYGEGGHGFSGDYASRGAAAPADQNGFGHWSSAAPAADARGFDYGGYGTQTASGGGLGQPNGGYAASQGNSYGATAQAGYGAQGHMDVGHGLDAGYQGQDEWGQGEGYDQEPSLDPQYGRQGYGHETGTIEQSYVEDEEYEDEPRRRRKLPLIAAAVAGALLCGGGLAYGYKTFLGPVPGGNTPLIKTSSIPSKVKPDDPGGRKFAHSEPSIMGGAPNKIMGEPLTDGAGGGPAPPGESARKVQTVEVRPDGSVVPQSASDGPRPVAANAGSIDFPLAGETGSKSAEAPSAPAPQPPPQVIAKAEPTPPPPSPSSDSVVDEAPVAAAPKKVVAKRVAPADAPSGPAPTGAGWVAVLASVPVSANSQMDSLKQFADMQQKYNEVLHDKTPSVQEANLGEKGRYHRLVVGPPASRDSASSICGGLKSAGYSGCWVMQY